MPTIRDLVGVLRQRDGVEAAVVLGRDGLLIDSDVQSAIDAESMAALVPQIVAAGDEFGAHDGRGALQTAILEYGHGIAVVCVLNADAILLVLAQPSANLGQLLFELRRNRANIARSSDQVPDPGARLQVLVADDEPHIGRIIKMKLEQGPFDVTLAYDGMEALRMAEAFTALALALLDVMMPKMSGLDVLANIRKSDRLKAVPCIILTAAGQEQHYRQAIALGANDFLTKPFSPKKLYTRVAELTGVAVEEPEDPHA